jgi:hypothetical protein
MVPKSLVNLLMSSVTAASFASEMFSKCVECRQVPGERGFIPGPFRVPIVSAISISSPLEISTDVVLWPVETFEEEDENILLRTPRFCGQVSEEFWLDMVRYYQENKNTGFYHVRANVLWQAGTVMRFVCMPQ